MNIKTLLSKTIIILIVSNVFSEEMASSTSEATYTTTKSMADSQLRNTTDYSDEQEWKSNESNDYYQMERNKLPGIDLAILNKYRRYGNVDSPKTWENEYQNRRYSNRYPEQNRFTDDPRYHREKNRFNENVYPVQVQGCSQYLRDVSQNKDETSVPIRDGILQGWLGGAHQGQSDKNKDNKNFIMSPYYVTTASAKIAPSSHRNRESYYGKYGTNDDRISNNVPTRSKLYDSEYKVQDSTPRDIFNSGNNNYMDGKSVYPWRPSSQHEKNRVIYYDYNLDDTRRPNSNYYPGFERNCPFYLEYHNCETELHRLQQMFRNQPNRRPYDWQNLPFQDKSLSTSTYDESTERPFTEYATEDTFRNGDRHEDRRRFGFTPSIGFVNEQNFGPVTSQAPFLSNRQFTNVLNEPVRKNNVV